MQRFDFTPFWKLTRWGFLFHNTLFGPALWINPGCDEYHNRTKFLIVPLVGMFTLWAKGSTWDEPHLYASTGDVWEGKYDPSCQICQEMINDNG